ncbi:MAG: hypothetical protein ACE5LC_01280 [Candidatus Aminicenantales bacterium]
MDAFLTKEAYQSLCGLHTISSPAQVDGLLFGHKRGERYYVEKIIPTQKGFFSSLESFIQGERLFEEEPIGFFSFHCGKKKLEKILKPFAYGRLFFEIKKGPKKRMEIKSFTIDFDKDFFLTSVKLVLPERR